MLSPRQSIAIPSACWPLAALVVVLLGGAGSSRAEAPPAGALLVTPPQTILRGPDAVQQLAVSGPEGEDLTDAAEFASANPAVATVDASGLVTAQGDGATTIAVRHGELSAT